MSDLRLAFVGPMLGRNPGWVLTQGEILADLFTREGYPVRLTSTVPNRILRLADTVRSLVAWRREMDVVTLMVFSGAAFIVADVASWVVKQIDKPLVLWLHGGNLLNFAQRYPQWVRRVFRRGDELVSPSGYLAHFFRAWGFNVEVIPNVLAIEQYPYRLRRQLAPRLMWMRAFHPVYNPEMAVRVLAHVRKAAPEATLVIAGRDAGIQADVQRLVHKLGLDGAVRFPGYLDMAAKVREGNAADIFLNTNHVDNMPVSVVEACAMGLPVVATNVGGIPDLLTDGETGLLIPDDDDQAMAAAVLHLLHDPDLAARLSANGRRLAERSSWEQVQPQWENLFAEVMAQAQS